MKSADIKGMVFLASLSHTSRHLHTRKVIEGSSFWPILFTCGVDNIKHTTFFVECTFTSVRSSIISAETSKQFLWTMKQSSQAFHSMTSNLATCFHSQRFLLTLYMSQLRNHSPLSWCHTLHISYGCQCNVWHACDSIKTLGPHSSKHLSNQVVARSDVVTVYRSQMDNATLFHMHWVLTMTQHTWILQECSRLLHSQIHQSGKRYIVLRIMWTQPLPPSGMTNFVYVPDGWHNTITVGLGHGDGTTTHPKPPITEPILAC